VVAGALALTILSAGGIHNSVEGRSYITVMGGARWVPNWYFEDKFKIAETPLVPRLFPGGPSGVVSFAYAPFSSFEIAIDLFASSDTFEVTRDANYLSISYGALLMGKYTSRNLLFEGFNPFLGVGVGPMLNWLGRSGALVDERLQVAVAAAAGFQFQFTSNLGLAVDLRYIFARRWFPEVAGLNVGGVAAHVGVTYFFPVARMSEF
jgi:hypothetical protein